MERWESRDLGELKEFLHMRIGHAGQNIYIDQAQYLQAVLQQWGMVNAKAVPTPLPVGYAPVKSLDKAADPELRKRYQTVIGSLLYLMLGTGPDISFAVTKMAQFAANPTEDHLSHALYICRYLVGTVAGVCADLLLSYQRNSVGIDGNGGDEGGSRGF